MTYWNESIMKQIPNLEKAQVKNRRDIAVQCSHYIPYHRATRTIEPASIRTILYKKPLPAKRSVNSGPAVFSVSAVMVRSVLFSGLPRFAANPAKS